MKAIRANTTYHHDSLPDQSNVKYKLDEHGSMAIILILMVILKSIFGAKM
jgi:hypothetical protein